MNRSCCLSSRFMLLAWLCVMCCGQAVFAQNGSSSDKPQQEELEAQFAASMSGATLIGQFSVNDVNDGKPLAQDRYQLGTVKKLPNGLWSIEARIQYGEHDVKLPLALPIQWAGDTPVITVTKIAFPGLGTYSARVLIYENQYAGTWSGNTHGGQMWGRIIREDHQRPSDSQDTAADTASE